MEQSKARGRARRQLPEFTAKHTPGPVSADLNCSSLPPNSQGIQVPMWVVTETEPIMGVVQVVDRHYVLQLTCWKAGQASGASWQVRLDTQRLHHEQVLDYGLYLTQQYLLTLPAEHEQISSRIVLSTILLAFDTL